MEIASEWFEVAGLALILTFATVVLVRALTLAIRGRHHSIRFGVELIIVFTILYLFSHHVIRLSGWHDFIEPLERILAFLWWISLAFTINSSLSSFLWTGLLSDNGVRRVPKLLTGGISLLIYACAIMIVMHYVYDESIMAILATSGAAAFVIGLSAQSTLREVFAGLSLNLAHSIRVGDFVEIEEIYGEIYDIDWRSVSVKNPHTGSLYIFPNSVVSEKVILNFSQPTKLFKYWLKFHVEYSASPDLVISTIAEELKHTKFVRRDPKPDFNILGFTDLGMEYRVRFNFDGDDPWWDAQNEMCMAIWSSLRRKGIRLSIDRHKLLSGDEQENNPWVFNNLIVEKDSASLSLDKNTVLGELSVKQLEDLGQSTRFLDFTPPDCIYKAGVPHDDIYYIEDGEFSMLQYQDDDSEVLVGRYSSGDCIGLETLNNDVENISTIRAERFSIIYKLDASLLKTMVSGSDSATNALNDVLAKQLEQQKQNLKLYAETIRKSKHAEHHATINLHLRGHVEDVFSKPLLHRFLHVLFPRAIEKDLLEALMAGCALIVSARGEVDSIERDFLRKKFGEIGLFKHVEVEDGLKLFESDVQNIQNHHEQGTHTALAKLKAISSEPRLASIVMGIAHCMTSLHGDLLDAEKAQLEQVAKTLKMPIEIEHLVDVIKK